MKIDWTTIHVNSPEMSLIPIVGTMHNPPLHRPRSTIRFLPISLPALSPPHVRIRAQPAPGPGTAFPPAAGAAQQVDSTALRYTSFSS